MKLFPLLLIAVGGACGSVARVFVTGLLSSGRLPWGTLAVNIIGCCAIGWLLGRLGPPTAENARWHALLVVGFCGGFTTFSAFSAQLYEQLRSGHFAMALTHALLSVTACLVATAIGWRVARF